MHQSDIHRVVCFGEVLWDVLPSGEEPGGAPINVAYHLKQLGENPAVITKIGDDEYGKKLQGIFSKKGVCTEYFTIDEAQATGLVYANMNNHQEVVYDIVNPSAWDFIKWKPEFSELVRQATYFVYGSLASRNETSRQTLLQLLKSAKLKVLDINLRAPHYNPQQVEALLTTADVLKMNIAELELITGWFGGHKTTEEKINLLQDRFDIKTVIVTMGGDGAIVNSDGRFYQHPGFKVLVTDTIGSGDAFLAGFLHQQIMGSSIERSLEFASGMGAFIATQTGACPDYDLSEITELIKAGQSPEGAVVI